MGDLWLEGWGLIFLGSYILYTHMIAQRRKVMRGKQRKE
jgi:hypothetical protein